MKHYRKQSGVYFRCVDDNPVSETMSEVRERPSENHVFADNWQTDPMNPAVCWRLKTTAELDAEKVVEFTSRLDNKTQRLLFEINFDQENRMRALEGKPAITKTQYRDALINVWKGLT